MIGLSYVFYGWVVWIFCLLLLLTTTVTYVGGAWVNATSTERARRIAMGVSVGALLAILGWFKYYGFVSVNLDNLTHALDLGRAVPLLQVGLPIAISFFTFMAISYVVDVYRRQLEPAKPLDVAVYISFFPTCWPGRSCGAASCCPRSAGAATPTRSTTRGRSGSSSPGCSRRW